MSVPVSAKKKRSTDQSSRNWLRSTIAQLNNLNKFSRSKRSKKGVRSASVNLQLRRPIDRPSWLLSARNRNVLQS